DGPGIGVAVGFALQPDMGRRRGLFRVNPPQAVAHQFQLALDTDQIEAAVQVEKFFDDPYRDPVEVVQGLIFLGQVVEGHEGVVLQGAKVILPEFPPLFRHPGGNLCQVHGGVHIDSSFRRGTAPPQPRGRSYSGAWLRRYRSTPISKRSRPWQSLMTMAGRSCTSRRWMASGPNSGKAITRASLMHREIRAPAPPVAP